MQTARRLSLRWAAVSLTVLSLALLPLEDADAQAVRAAPGVLIDLGALDVVAEPQPLHQPASGLLFPGMRAPRSRLQVAPLTAPPPLPPTYRQGVSRSSAGHASTGRTAPHLSDPATASRGSIPGYTPSPSIVDGTLTSPPSLAPSSQAAARAQNVAATTYAAPIAGKLKKDQAERTEKASRNNKKSKGSHQGSFPGYTPSPSIVDGSLTSPPPARTTQPAPAVAAPAVHTSPPVAAAPHPAQPPAAPALPPATPPVTPVSAPASSAPAASRMTGDTSTLLFASGDGALPAGSEGVLKSLADRLNSNNSLSTRVQAYAGGGNDGNSSRARRLSLSRALAVRSWLLDQGIDSSRIEVRALGTPDSGNPDRVEIAVMKP